METSPTIAALAEALSKAQAVMHHAQKDRVNPHFKNRYATLSSVWDACREALTSNGLSVAQPTSAENGAIYVRTILMHKSGEWMSSTLAMAGAQASNPQQLGSLISYARRYALSSMVGICADEDDDATSTVKAPTHAQAPTNPPKANQAGDAKDPGKPAPPAAETARPLTDAQRWNVAVATIRRKVGAASGDVLIAEITAKHTPAGTTKVPDDKRAALIADLELAAKG